MTLFSILYFMFSRLVNLFIYDRNNFQFILSVYGNRFNLINRIPFNSLYFASLRVVFSVSWKIINERVGNVTSALAAY